MAPKRRKLNLDASSSPDPLAISAQEDHLPLRTPSRRMSSSPSKAILRSVPLTRSKSPQKTVLLDPISEPGGASPWRIRVTVQAEPKDEHEGYGRVKTVSPSRSPAKRVTTMTIPLKDPDSEVKSPKKGRGKPRRSATPGRRPPTPARKLFGHDYDLENDPTYNPSVGLKDYFDVLSPKKSPKRSRRKSVTPSVPAEDEDEGYIQQIPSGTGRPPGETEQKTRRRSRSPEPASQPLPTKQNQATHGRLTPATQPVSLLSSSASKQARSGPSKWSDFSSLPARNATLNQPAESSRASVESMMYEDDTDSAARHNSDNSEDEHEIHDDNQSEQDIADDYESQDEGNHIQNGHDDENVQIQVDNDVDVLESGDEDYNEDMPDIDNDEVIGEETMMKSMDMTIVSPRSLYSRLDIDSSRLENSKKEEVKQRFSSPKESLSSSPHVKFSSPLVAPTPDQVRRNSRATSSSRDMDPPSRSNLKTPQHSSSPNIRTNVFKPLPTPDSDEKSDEDEKSSYSQTYSSPVMESTEERETRWQRERQEISKQALAGQSVTIEDDNEEEKADEDEENAQDVQMEDDEDDVDSDEDLWQEAANHSSTSLQDSSRLSNHPSIAAYRATKRIVSNEALNPPQNEADFEIEDESQSEEAGSNRSPKQQSDISMLFNRYAANRTAQTDQSPGSDDASPDSSKEDLSSYVKRKVSGMMAGVDYSFTTPGRKALQSTSVTTSIPVQFGSSTSSVKQLPSIPTHSPKKSSPLKRRIHLDSSSSSSDTSDIRQLKDETQAAKRQALEGQDTAPLARQWMRKTSPRRSLLQKTAVRQAKRAYPEEAAYARARKADRKMSGLSSVASSFLSDHADEAADVVGTGLLSRLWSYVSSTPTAPSEKRELPIPHPSHYMLRGLQLLPDCHPWSENHFRTLLKMYKHWQTHPDRYDPFHPANIELLTDEWLQYVDIEFSNWGYTVTIDATLIILCALFNELLLLESAEEFSQQHEGYSLEYGFVGQRTIKDGKITPWHIILRLFTVAVGDVVREEERKGVIVERKKELRWKKKGEWLWRRGWVFGLF